MAKKKKKAKDDDEKPKKGKKAKPVVEEEEEEEYSPEEAAKPRLDIYVGLSAITMLVLIGAAVFFYVDADAAQGKSPPQVNMTLGSLDGTKAAPPR
jgi:hypothetical protein